MKKIITFCLITILAVLLTACGAGDVQNPANQSNSEVNTEKASEEKVVSQDDYEDNVNGLKKYFEDSGYVSGDPVKMSAQFIGAKEGYRYQFKYGKSQVIVELYEYDLDNLNSTADKVLDSVGSNGYFMMDKTQVNAYMSDNGKYIMIYTDNSKDHENQTRKDEVIENFKTFK